MGPVYILVFGAMVLGGATLAGIRYVDDMTAADLRLGRLQLENRQLDASVQELNGALQNAMLELEIGAVTQLELERQIAILNEQLKQAREELEFMKNAGEAN